LNTIRIIARISKFRCFHETKQTQNEVERFFYNLAEFVFEYFHDSRRILASLAKFFSNRFSQHDRTVEPVPVTSSSTRSSYPPSPTRVFWRNKSLQNPSPALNFKHGISLKRFRYLPATFHFRAEIGRLRTRKKNCEPGKGFVKICCVKKARVGEGGELERALDDVIGTGSTVRSCCEKRFEKNFAKDAKILHLSWKHSKTNSAKL